MKKLKLLGIRKSSKHNCYIFPKKQEFFQIVRELLKELKFEKYKWDGFARPKDKRYGEPNFDKEDKIKDYTDKICHFENKDAYIEIIFGKDKVFLSIHTKKDRQQKLSRFLSKFMED